MPRPEQVIPSAGEEAEHGADTELQDIAAAAPLAEPMPEALPEEELGFIPEEVGLPPGPEDDLAEDEDVDDMEPLEGWEQDVFGPTAREFEPPTAGMPHGPGSNLVRLPQESDQQFMRRVADILDQSGNEEAVAFSKRIRRQEFGEG
jgi:hypothetical protein